MKRATLLILLTLCLPFSCSSSPPESLPYAIAHAGGGVNGRIYLNSKESIEKNHIEKGYTLFEVDMEWTSDGELVMIHDWGRTLKNNFPQWQGKKPSLTEFLALEMVDGHTQLDLSRLIKLLDKYPKISIVSDIKSKNIEALRHIKERYPSYTDRFIPQIYHRQEYQPVTQMGFENIIFTLYRSNASDDEIVKFAKENPLKAITIYKTKLENSDLAKSLIDNNQAVFVHTINSLAEFSKFHTIGVTGVYTDTIPPKKLSNFQSGQLLALSSTLQGDDQYLPISINVAGFQQATLMVNDSGDGKGHDHANWCDLKVLTEDNQSFDTERLRIESSSQQWGELGVNRNLKGGQLMIDNYQCQSGFATHSNSEIEIALPQDSRTLQANIGLDSTSQKKGSVRFEILLTNTKIGH